MTVRQHSILYTWPFERVMFASGNDTERKRMGSVHAKGETVVDLYAVRIDGYSFSPPSPLIYRELVILQCPSQRKQAFSRCTALRLMMIVCKHFSEILTQMVLMIDAKYDYDYDYDYD